MVDIVTNLYTLQTEFGLTQRAVGSGSVVFTTARWSTDIVKLKNPGGAKKTIDLMIKLATITLDKPISQGWIKYPMVNTGGVLELRTEGMRSYGKVIGRDETGRTLVVFDSAEDKAFEDATDPDLTERAKATAEPIAARWKQLQGIAGLPNTPSVVTSLSEPREKRSKNKTR